MKTKYILKNVEKIKELNDRINFLVEKIDRELALAKKILKQMKGYNTWKINY